ncbi:hypothetical protein NQZ68_042230 [Dissostichus eleginoides]|nr:hypothetical protein NQZ68_041996 [Dissostichus eleginoides]KAI9540299.1 hypothetical protein NQZ68_042230 [Dissostichus eleginoides]
MGNLTNLEDLSYRYNRILSSNQFHFLKETDSSPFRNLSKLKDLKLDGQRPHGLTVLPNYFFRGLHTLKSLDFELGRNIVDNIVSAVYSSRKTICVVSRNFLKSEWCSLEIQLASYRLFDEHRDVLLLVFLEQISERQVSCYHRMRKVILKKTYLQWPSSDCTDPTQAQALFWNQLRRAIRSGRKINNEVHEEEEPGNVDTHTSDEKYYLLT